MLLEQTIRQPGFDVAPSQVVMNAGDAMTLRNIAANAIPFGGHPVRAAGHSLPRVLLEE